MITLLRGGKILLFVLVLIGLSATTALSPQEAYVEKYRDLAISEMHRTGIPASIKLAQALVESDSGQSILASRANNHFGIKCKSYWGGSRYFYADDDRDHRGRLTPSCFRMYNTASESYSDHSTFLLHSERYDRLFTYSRDDYKKWAHGLKACGYATDSRYAQKLINVIEKYKLARWDSVSE